MNKNTIRVYDTITKKYVDIEVNEEIRAVYNRTGWNINDNDESFYKHEIQFSSLKGSADGNFENFHEFQTENDVVEDSVINHLESEKLHKCMELLSVQDRKLIELLFFDGKTERECAEIYGISQKNINKKKTRILCRLHKLLEKFNF